MCCFLMDIRMKSYLILHLSRCRASHRQMLETVTEPLPMKAARENQLHGSNGTLTKFAPPILDAVLSAGSIPTSETAFAIKNQYEKKRSMKERNEKAHAEAVKRLMVCAICLIKFPWQEHISHEKRRDYFRRGASVICASCLAKGYTSRRWRSYRLKQRNEKAQTLLFTSLVRMFLCSKMIFD